MATLLIYRIFQNEILKLKRTFAFRLTIIGASFIPFIYFVFHVLKYKSLIPDTDINPWNKFMSDQIMSAGSILIPLYIVLLTSLIIQIEHKSNAVKYIFSEPVPKWTIYFTKLFIVVLSVIFTYVLFVLMMLFSGLLVGILRTELNFLAYSPQLLNPLKILFRSFLASLGIISLQFWLSFRFRNFIVSLGIGIVLVISGLIVFQAEEAKYFPYAYNRLSLFFYRVKEMKLGIFLISRDFPLFISLFFQSQVMWM